MSRFWSGSGTPSTVMAGFTMDIEMSKIRQPKNVFREISEVQDLARSLKQKGLLQPILVRTVEGYYEIVAGNRRFLACKTLGWKRIACHIIELDDKEAFEISLVENIQRKRISPIDEAKAFKLYVSDFGWGGVSDLASKIGKSISYISKRISLLDLPKDVLESIINRKLDTSIAEELSPIRDKSKQSFLANLVIERRVPLRRARKLIETFESEVDSSSSKRYTTNPIDHVRIAERSFDKTITAIKIAMNILTEVIEGIEHDWILYEVLMQHKSMLHNQIDILLKEKRKL